MGFNSGFKGLMPIMLIYSTKTQIQQIKHNTLLNEYSVFF